MSFGAVTAEIYIRSTRREDTLATVDFLVKLSEGGATLELAIGTGRVALPLADRGVPVAGIDFSPEMVEKLRSKPGGDRIPVTIGNFADLSVSGSYRLVYLIFNTLFNLLTQEEQVCCFENVAAHLNLDVRFVVEAITPAFLTRLRDDQYETA